MFPAFPFVKSDCDGCALRNPTQSIPDGGVGRDLDSELRQG